MRKLFLITITMCGLLLTNCSKQISSDEMLKDESTRNEIFVKIASDHGMMTDFMEVMMKDNHAMMMIKDHEGMKNMMMNEGNMMDMMKNHPKMMHDMMDGMMKDKPESMHEMMSGMMKMMHEKGMMNSECMESSMQMMKEKDMGMENKKDSTSDHKHQH